MQNTKDTIKEVVYAIIPLSLAVFFGFLLGFVATMAEPDVRVLATQVDFVSDSVVSRNLLIYMP